MEAKELKTEVQILVDAKKMRQILGVSAPTFIKYRKKYQLPYVMFGGQFRFNPSKVLEALEKNNK